jgi:hypothetical protein
LPSTYPRKSLIKKGVGGDPIYLLRRLEQVELKPDRMKAVPAGDGIDRRNFLEGSGLALINLANSQLLSAGQRAHQTDPEFACGRS